MPKVVWSADNDRKLLIRLIDRSAKSYDSVSLALLFPGATPKAIEERIAKLKREAKALDGPKTSRTSSFASTNTAAKTASTPRKKRTMSSSLKQESGKQEPPSSGFGGFVQSCRDDEVLVEEYVNRKRVKREYHVDEDADYNPKYDK